MKKNRKEILLHVLVFGVIFLSLMVSGCSDARLDDGQTGLWVNEEFAGNNEIITRDSGNINELQEQLDSKLNFGTNRHVYETVGSYHFYGRNSGEYYGLAAYTYKEFDDNGNVILEEKRVLDHFHNRIYDEDLNDLESTFGFMPVTINMSLGGVFALVYNGKDRTGDYLLMKVSGNIPGPVYGARSIVLTGDHAITTNQTVKIWNYDERGNEKYWRIGSSDDIIADASESNARLFKIRYIDPFLKFFTLKEYDGTTMDVEPVPDNTNGGSILKLDDDYTGFSIEKLFRINTGQVNGNTTEVHWLHSVGANNTVYYYGRGVPIHSAVPGWHRVSNIFYIVDQEQ